MTSPRQTEPTGSSPAPPARLRAPAPGWQRTADVVVIGSGVAGLTTALRLVSEDVPWRVLVVTKDVLAAGSTQWAQGGIAAALGADDDPAEHLNDTLVAGVGLCDEDAVRALVTEGPEAVAELIESGARFDRDPDGQLQLAREGGHHRHRVVHAGGDATGAEVIRALIEAVHRHPRIEVIEHALVLDLLQDAAGATCGVTLHVMGEGARDGVGAVRSRAVVLATGGIGQVFAATTNPSVSTGDGVAAALRAGAVIRDLEFVQFHPTVLWLGSGAHGQQPLVSEAVRGEGAVLRDEGGERFMLGQHELAELAPRDVVAKGILRRMQQTGTEHVWLDGREFGEALWQRRFPSILESLRSHGIDPVTDLIPVVPASHYSSGGVRTDLLGHTSVPGLYACGEAACTGVHGANRLASNSLLEGLVFGRRIAADLLTRLPTGDLVPGEPVAPPAGGLVCADGTMPARMSAGAGVLRTIDGLSTVGGYLDGLFADAATNTVEPDLDSWQQTNLATVAAALVTAAALREETRGSHWREDFPERDDEQWRGHLDTVLHSGQLTTQYVPKGTR
ncbi:MAG: L-aspartate oxidase [Jatrophihabitans sp.]